MSSTLSIKDSSSGDKDEDNNNNDYNTNNNINTLSDSTGSIYCWGSGDHGQHGQGHSGDVSFLWSEVRQWGSSTAQGEVCSVSCGAHHNVMVTDSGEVYAWGDGRYGQLGCEDQTTRKHPTPVPLPTPPLPGAKIRTVACGQRHTLLLLDNGQVYTCGQSTSSDRDRSGAENQARLCLLQGLGPVKVTQVACGHKHSLFLLQDGSLAAMGNNARGQIGDGSRGDAQVPQKVTVPHSVTTIACGANHNLVITESNEVYCWGLGKACGKRRDDVTTPELVPFQGREIIQVAGGRTHSLALSGGGQVYSWGQGKHGQLGLGSVVISSHPRRLRHSCLEEGASSVACGDAFSALITVSGRLYMWGRNSHLIEEWMEPQHEVREPQCLNPEPLPPLRSVTCGVRHAIAVGGLPDFEHSSQPDHADELTTSESESELESDVTSSSCSSDEESDRSFISFKTEVIERHNDGAQMDFPEPAPISTMKATETGYREQIYADHPTLPVPGKLTRLTIGEFYCLSPDCSFLIDSRPPPHFQDSDAAPNMTQPPTSLRTQHPYHTPSLPSIIHRQPATDAVAPAANPQSDSSQAFPPSAESEHENRAQPLVHNVDLNALSQLAPKETASRRSKSSAHSIRSKSTSVQLLFPHLADDRTHSAPKKREGKHHQREGEAEEDEEEDEERAGDASSLGMVSRTSFQPTVQLSRSPLKNLPWTAERNVVVSRNVDFLDMNQLLVGPLGASPNLSTLSRCSPERSQLGPPERPGLGSSFDYCYDEMYDDEGSSLLTPTGVQKQGPPHRVPTFDIQGNFGSDKLKTASTVFGALSGHSSRGATKFFKKPVSIGHLSKTTTTTPAPKPSTPLTHVLHVGSLSELYPGAGEGATASEMPRNSSAVRFLGAVGNSNISSEEDFQRLPTAAHLFQASLLEAPRKLASPTKTLITLESKTSWQEKLPLLCDEEKKTQSAPSRRKRVTFADESRSTSVLGHAAKPSLAAAFAAVSHRPDSRPDFQAGSSRVSPRSEESEKSRSVRHRDRYDVRSRLIPALFGRPSLGKASARAQHPTPKLAYQRPSPGRQVTKSSAGPRSGTLRTLMTGPPRSALKNGEGHSRSELMVAGSRGRQTKRAHFD